MTTEAVGSTRASELLCRPWVAALVVLAVYGALALLNSTGGYLGTDTGAKVITLDRMAENQTLSPDVGYWAEEWDPDGAYHPLYQTRTNASGEWVSVTTLPMLIASVPLYALGGYHLSLLLPMLGAVLAAFAARDVASQLAGEREGWTAFWVTALASPIAVYALDLWEHSLGAGLMVGAFALLLRQVRGAASPWLPLGAGLALGLSASMRTESFVAALVFVGGACLALLLRRRVGWAFLSGALAVAGFGLPWFLNSLLEGSLEGNSRASRVGGVVERNWWSELTLRSKEALITWFGMPGSAYPGGVLLGVAIVGSIAVAARLLRRGERRAGLVAIGVATACYVLSFSSGLAFVPGALVAAPIIGVLVGTHRWDSDRRLVLGVALVTSVIVWMFQYTGGAGPQWGGRYLLAPTLLLIALGSVAVHEVDEVLRRAVLGMSVVVTVFGLVWLNQRSHEVEKFFDALANRSEQVVISTNGFLVREAGPAYDEQRYLSLGPSQAVEGAVRVIDAAGLNTFAVLTVRSEPPDLRVDPVGSEQVDFLGVPLWYHRFTLE